MLLIKMVLSGVEKIILCIQMLCTLLFHALVFALAVLCHVILQLTRPFAGVVALLASKRHLARVRKHVNLHATGLTARIIALIACKGLCSSVCENVVLEIISSSGGIVALIKTSLLIGFACVS